MMEERRLYLFALLGSEKVYKDLKEEYEAKKDNIDDFERENLERMLKQVLDESEIICNKLIRLCKEEFK